MDTLAGEAHIDHWATQAFWDTLSKLRTLRVRDTQSIKNVSSGIKSSMKKQNCTFNGYILLLFVSK